MNAALRNKPMPWPESVPARAAQRGFLLVTAVTLIVVAGLLLAVMVYLSATGTRSAALNLNAKQALFIAGTGLERGIRALDSPVLTERVACATVTGDVNLTNVSFGDGQFTVTGGAPVYSTPATTLRLGINATDSTIPVNSLAGYAAAGRVLIDREAVDYSEVEAADDTVCGGIGRAPCLVGAQRGRDGTTAVNHVIGTPLGQYQCDLQSRGGVPDLTAARGKRRLQQGIQLQEGWAVGNNGVIFRWDGTAWTNAASPVGSLINSVSMLSYADGWAVGNQAGGEVILRWSGGPNWSRLGPVGPIPNTNLNGVYCYATNDCWIVGNQAGGEVILRWSGGPNWTRLGPVGPIPNVNLNGVHCAGSGNCWAVGDRWNPPGPPPRQGSILQWTGGPNWNVVSYNGTRPNANLNSVFCVATNDCWAVGDRWNPPGPPPRQGSILRWTGGPNWNVVSYNGTRPNAHLNSVYCMATNDCWAVGNRWNPPGPDPNQGSILRWTGGPNWNVVSYPAPMPAADYYSVYCVTPNDCWIAGNRSGGEVLLHWDGAAWSRLPVSGGLPNQNLRAIHVVGPRGRPQAAWREVFP